VLVRDLVGAALAVILLIAASAASASWAIVVLAAGAGMCAGLVGWDVWRGIRSRRADTAPRWAVRVPPAWSSLLGRDVTRDGARSDNGTHDHTDNGADHTHSSNLSLPRATLVDELPPPPSARAALGPSMSVLAVSITREELRPFGPGMLLVGVELTAHNPTDRSEFIGPVTWIPAHGGLGDTGAADVQQWLRELGVDHPPLPGHVDTGATVVGWQWAVFVDAPDPHAPDYRVTVEDGSGRVYEPSLPPPSPLRPDPLS
jgi:hypothetical protein